MTEGTKIVARSGTYSANTVTTLYENTTGNDLVISSISVYNPGVDDVIQIYTTTSGGTVQEYLLYGNVGASKILTNTDKIWLLNGQFLKFKTTALTTPIISANLYG